MSGPVGLKFGTCSPFGQEKVNTVWEEYVARVTNLIIIIVFESQAGVNHTYLMGFTRCRSPVPSQREVAF